MVRDSRRLLVSEEEKVKYMFASLGLTMIFGGGTSVTVAGAKTANAKGDSQHFIERYICISFPLILQLYVAFYAINYLIRYKTGDPLTLAAFATVPYVLGYVCYFALLRHYIRSVSKTPTIILRAAPT